VDVISGNWTPFPRLIGIKTAQPKTMSTKNMFRHILRTLRKTVASSPIKPTSSCSFVFRTGPIHANIPFPIGGGACLSSAILSFGAYTRELYGRRREKPTARRSVNPTEVPKPATIEACASCWGISMECYMKVADVHGRRKYLQKLERDSPVAQAVDLLTCSGAVTTPASI
jgi:hypothetical protein